VVLARGAVPADILFCGEAPGASEDILGKPFCGPAGKLLDYIIETAIDGQYDYALTNLIACIPLGEDGEKTAQPSEESIKACAPRLLEFVKMCRPRLIVLVGALAAKYAKDFGQVKTIQIVHPAAILRADISTRGLAIQRAIVQLEDALVDGMSPANV
jgi:uracil-DNA glycosylase family 4